MKKINDLDLLHASSRVRALSCKIISARQLYQMIDAHNLYQAFKVLNEVGIGIGVAPESYNAALNKSLLETYTLVKTLSNDLDLFDIFRYGYDGLNLKILVKAQAIGKDPEYAMTDLSTVSKADAVKGFDMFPPALAAAAETAQEELARTADPQRADIIIDTAVFQAMLMKSREYDNAFLHRVVDSRIDLENIKSIVRIVRSNKDLSFLKSVISVGGAIPAEKYYEAFPGGMGAVISFIDSSVYGRGLSRSFQGLEAGRRITLFEKLCDDCLISLQNEGDKTVLGVEPVLTYMFEKENEAKAVRMVLSSKIANIPADTIIERLRGYG